MFYCSLFHWHHFVNLQCECPNNIMYGCYFVTAVVLHWPGTQVAIIRHCFNTLRPRQDGRRFADDTFKCIFLNENVRISIKISLKCVPKGPINNNPALVQIMAWRRPGDKPLSGPMMAKLPTHICVTRPQWVKEAESVIWIILLLIISIDLSFCTTAGHVQHFILIPLWQSRCQQTYIKVILHMPFC